MAICDSPENPTLRGSHRGLLPIPGGANGSIIGLIIGIPSRVLDYRKVDDLDGLGWNMGKSPALPPPPTTAPSGH